MDTPAVVKKTVSKQPKVPPKNRKGKTPPYTLSSRGRTFPLPSRDSNGDGNMYLEVLRIFIVVAARRNMQEYERPLIPPLSHPVAL